jgi:SAM-dependent methyltransferase
VGCGEGRLSRDLAARGHRVVGVDASPTMVALSREADCSLAVHPADAAVLPFADASADLVIHFMSLQDIDNMAGAIGEAAFHSEHRPLAVYFAALESAGFLVEALREHAVPDHSFRHPRGKCWQRIPLFLHVRAVVAR